MPACLPAILAMFVSAVAYAQSTAFTYQGDLRDGGAPANGPYDMRFRLLDSASGGAQVGATLCADGISVTDGTFSVQLDFGQQFATASPRFLEISVRPEIGQPCSDVFAYVLLSPRQLLTATPLASHAKSAATAFSLSAPDGSPADAVFVDNAGGVGIGTSLPAGNLHIVGNRASFRLQDDDSPTSYALFDDQSAGQMRINKVADATISFIDINPMIVNGTSNTHVRFFRETSTTGQRSVIFHSGNNSAAQSATIGVGGQSSFFQLDGGNLGIGTSTPGSRLDVRGSIRLGNNGQLFAAAALSPVRIVCAAINSLGSEASSNGYIVSRPSTGHYTVTFTTAFPSEPAVTATPLDEDDGPVLAMVSGVTTTGCSIRIMRANGTYINRGFSFIAVGSQ